MRPQKPTAIEKGKVILVEGADAYYFFIWACQAFGVSDIQVLDFGGVDDLGEYLKAFKGFSGFENARSVLIGRDEERDPKGAEDSIRNALRKNVFATPERPFAFAEGSPRVAYMLFPGFASGSTGPSQKPGTLETLCLSTTEGDPVHDCVGEYLTCLEKQGNLPSNVHKTRLYAYLAGKHGLGGLKLGEAARAGAWNWNHVKLEPFKKIIQEM